MKKFDIVIVGQGIVGLLAANLLAQCSDINILITDPNPVEQSWDKSIYDSRCFALTPGTIKILNNLNIWENIQEQRVGDFSKMLIWDQTGTGEFTLDAKDTLHTNLGSVVENRVICLELYNRLLNYKNITIINSKICNISSNIDHATLNLLCSNESLDQVQAKLVIAADGARSFIRTQIKTLCSELSYQQTAIVATIQSSIDHGNIARQRFSQTGPLAFLPLQEKNLSSIVWTTSTIEAKRLLALDMNEFCNELRDEFACRLGQLTLKGPRIAFPLRRLHATRYLENRIVLAGDAAHVIHPLAGQGVNLGVMDVVSLVAKIISTYEKYNDVYNYSLLRKYERQRKYHNLSVMGLMEGLHNLYTSDKQIVQVVRNIGMNIFDKGVFSKQMKKKAIDIASMFEYI